MKILIVVVFISLIAVAETSEQLKNESEERKLVQSKEICSTPPGNFSKNSSKTGEIGIGGFRGKSCATSELVFVHGDYYGTTCWVPQKGEPINLGNGLAAFSPDCKYFWFFTEVKVEIRDAVTGEKIASWKGEDPAWLSGSEGVVFSRRKKNEIELVQALLSKQETILASFPGYRSCQAPGEGILFLPPEVEGDRISFSYPMEGKVKSDDYGDYRKAMKVVIDRKSKKVISKKATRLECE